MGSFSGLVIVLSFLFGCILMGLVAELYYLLWWKKKTAYTRNNNNNTNTAEIEGFCYIFNWKKPNSSQELTTTNSVTRNPQEQVDLEIGSTKDLGLTKGNNNNNYGEEGVETELMRLHNLCGPPRFLFTIKEESKEDLESEDGKSRKGSRTKSLSDLFLTPLSSPTLKTPHLSDSYHNHYGFNPLFESLSEAEVNRLRSSPPPKFKFLKDAEDKLIRRLLVEEAERKSGMKNEGPVQDCVVNIEEKDVSFVKLTHQSAQVLPLASSPTLKSV